MTLEQGYATIVQISYNAEPVQSLDYFFIAVAATFPYPLQYTDRYQSRAVETQLVNSLQSSYHVSAISLLD